VRLEKVAQSYSKVLLLLSKHLLCFTVLLIVKIKTTSIKVHALLDSRASACFVDKDIVDCHKLPLIAKETSYPRTSY
jgi:hypothetical protein